MRGAEVQRRLDSPGRWGQEAQPTFGQRHEPSELVSTSERRSGGGSGVGPCCIVHPNKFDHYSMRFIVAGPSNGRVGDVCSLWRRVSVVPGPPASAPPTMGSDTWTKGRGKPPPRLLFLVAFHPSGDSNVEEDKAIQASQFDGSSFNFMLRTNETIIMLN